MTEPFVVESHDFDGGRVIAMQGELDASTRRGLTELLSGPPGSLIVVDLARLTFLDSSGLGALHEARQKAIENGGSLVLCHPGALVQRVLEITGLDIWVVAWDPAWSNDTTLGAVP